MKLWKRHTIPREARREMLKHSITVNIPDNPLDAVVMMIAGVVFFLTHKKHLFWALPTASAISDAIFNHGRGIMWLIHHLY